MRVYIILPLLCAAFSTVAASYKSMSASSWCQEYGQQPKYKEVDDDDRYVIRFSSSFPSSVCTLRFRSEDSRYRILMSTRMTGTSRSVVTYRYASRPLDHMVYQKTLRSGSFDVTTDQYLELRIYGAQIRPFDKIEIQLRSIRSGSNAVVYRRSAGSWAYSLFSLIFIFGICITLAYYCRRRRYQMMNARAGGAYVVPPTTTIVTSYPAGPQAYPTGPFPQQTGSYPQQFVAPNGGQGYATPYPPQAEGAPYPTQAVPPYPGPPTTPYPTAAGDASQPAPYPPQNTGAPPAYTDVIKEKAAEPR